MTDQTTKSILPESIGRYKIESEIGRGGMSTVYKAYDPRFKREVALKVMPHQFTHDPTFRARFEREAQALAAIEHPAIVPVYDFGEENEQPYLVLRYMHGGSLSDLLRHGPLPLSECVRIFSRLAPALDEMHSRGIVHRDLKPGNILFDQYGNSFLADFGIARLTQATTTLTGDSILGTPSYMSPEQARGESDIDGRSDIYALGAILFEMLTGKKPYQATTPMGVAMKHITDPIPRVLDVNANLPPECDTVISTAMAKEREKRYQSASEMVAAEEMIVRKQTAGLRTGIPARSTLPPTTIQSMESIPPPRRSTAQVSSQPIPKPPSPIFKQPASEVIPMTGPVIPPTPAIPQKKPRLKTGILVTAFLVVAVICLIGMVFGVVKLLTPSAPTAAPDVTPMAGEAPYFSDDFSDPSSGWSPMVTDNVITIYQDGMFRIFVNAPQSTYWSNPGLNYSDVVVEVTAHKTGGPDDNMYGVICRYQDNDNFYFLTITSTGYASIHKFLQGELILIGSVLNSPSDAILGGNSPNIIHAECIQNTLTISANGEKLLDAEDGDIPSGDVGLIVGTYDEPGVDILFDDFVANTP